MRRFLLVLTVLLLPLLGACGGEDRSGDSSRDVELDRTNRDEVILGYGEAYFRSDVRALERYYAPGSPGLGTLDPSWVKDREQFGAEVRLEDLDFSVTKESADSVVVSYSGIRCAPTEARDFGPTSVAGAPESAPQGDGGADGGAQRLGEQICTDIQDASAGAAMAEFERRDGQWYAIAPGL